ncbi:hypothetical protein BGX20_007186, partial [Mortierella sp. AD010]
MIPYDHLQYWRDNVDDPEISSNAFECDWGKDILISGKSKKVFAVVYMNYHWGAACVDFENRRVYFGDSIGQDFPDDARKAIAKWLVYLGMDLKDWKPQVLKFNVPRQTDNGSCGVIACNAIDRAHNEKITPWSSETSTCHRLRLMRLLTGYTMKLKDEIECLSLNGKHRLKNKVTDSPFARSALAPSKPLYNDRELKVWLEQAEILAKRREEELLDDN